MKTSVSMVFLLLALIFPDRGTAEPIKFEANPSYGYVYVVDTTQEPRSYFEIVEFSGKLGEFRSLTRFDAMLAPQLCARDAISFLSSNEDSTYLIVVQFADPDSRDTITSCLKRHSTHFREISRWKLPSQRGLIGLLDHFFLLKDSLLFWEPYYPGHSQCIEIGKIDSSGQYSRLSWMFHSSMPNPATDFSFLLFDSCHSVPNGPFDGSSTTHILSYDLKLDSVFTIDSIDGSASDLKCRDLTEGIWYMAYTGEMDINLCRVKNGQVTQMTTLE